jgi:hypothetical protein
MHQGSRAGSFHVCRERRLYERGVGMKGMGIMAAVLLSCPDIGCHFGKEKIHGEYNHTIQ